jgi:Protein of unknown function (DUF3455)
MIGSIGMTPELGPRGRGSAPKEPQPRPARRIALMARLNARASRLVEEERRPTLVEPFAQRRSHVPRAARPALAAILAVVAAWPLAQVAYAGPPAPEVPGTIAVTAENQKVFLVAHAVGVQIHSCKATTSSGYQWSFVAPRADLYDDNGKLIVTHFGGPTWQAREGSYVVGQRVDGVTVDATAIPWLLLRAASKSAGPDGDRLALTTFIQRIATTGGLAPAAAECNEATAGNTREVPYTADYVFWKSTDS